MFFQEGPQDPQSIDALVYDRARRRMVREVVSMVVTGVLVVALFATFYKILVS
jgi:hypothetical protein